MLSVTLSCLSFVDIHYSVFVLFLPAPRRATNTDYFFSRGNAVPLQQKQRYADHVGTHCLATEMVGVLVTSPFSVNKTVMFGSFISKLF